MNEYEVCLHLAGVFVHAFKSFGSYQGEWYALVTTGEGETGWIVGSYGSCSGCDAFQGEFGIFESHEHFGPEGPDYISMTDTEKWWDHCETCQDYRKRLTAFGERYLEYFQHHLVVVQDVKEKLSWDYEAQEVLDFVETEWEALNFINLA